MDFDIRGLFDEAGNPKPIHTLTREQTRALALYRISNRQGGKELGYTIRLWDKLRALELLMRHLGLLDGRGKHRVEESDRVTGDEIMQRLHEGRKRSELGTANRERLNPNVRTLLS